MNHFAPVAAIFGLAVAMPAQWFVVDANNWPGADFTSLVTALTTVPDGATLVVRSGDYTVPSTITVTGKGLTLVCEEGARVANITFTGLAANQTLVIRGLQVGPWAANGTLALQSCSGRVLLEECTYPFFGGSRLDIRDCAAVSVARCVFTAGARFESSNVVCTDTYMHSSAVNAAGLSITGGDTQLVGCAVSGADGSASVFPGPGIFISGATLRLLGSTTVDAGAPVGPFNNGITGSGVVRKAPTVALAGAAGISPGIVLSTVQEAATRSTGAALGGSFTATLAGPASLHGGLVFGTPRLPIVVAGIADELWLDPIGYTGVQSLATPFSVALFVPNVAALLGVAFAWQGVTVGTSGVVLSNPTWFCVQ